MYDFAEAAALNVKEDLSNQREPRNLSPKQALKYLIKGQVISKYHFHGNDSTGIWLPDNLKRGHIMRCELPTDYNRDSHLSLSTRNLLCLGFDVDPKTADLLAIRALRFSYHTERYTNTSDLFIATRDPDMEYATHSTFSKDVLLRTGSSVDIIPVNSIYWGHHIDAMSETRPEFMDAVESKIQNIIETNRHAHQHTRNYAELNSMDSVFVPTLDPSELGAFEHQIFPEHLVGKTFYDLNDEQQQELTERMLSKHLFASYWRDQQIQYEQGITKRFYEARMQMQQALSERVKGLTEQYSSEDIQTIAQYAQSTIAEHNNQMTVADDESDQNAANDNLDIKVINLPTLDDLLAQSTAAFSESKNKKSKALKQIYTQQADRNSIEKLADLGIGCDVTHDDDLNLHKHLWLGRYHMLNLPSLVDRDLENESVNRPAALTRLWVRPNDEGEAEIAYLGFIPCTRGEQNHFRYKMKVRPLDTTVKKPTQLIAEQEVIIPASAQYLKANQPDMGTFYELLPDDVETLMKKRELARKEYGDLKYRVLTPDDIPEDCVEIDLPETPNEKLRKKFTNWGIARFNYETAPVKRPIKGSRRTARNFKGKKVTDGFNDPNPS